MEGSNKIAIIIHINTPILKKREIKKVRKDKTLKAVFESIAKEARVTLEASQFEFKYFDQESSKKVPSILQGVKKETNNHDLEPKELQAQVQQIESAVYSKFIDMNLLVMNLRKKEIELVPKPNELNGGIVGLHTDNRIFSIEEHI